LLGVITEGKGKIKTDKGHMQSELGHSQIGKKEEAREKIAV